MENSRLLTFLIISLAIVIFYNQLLQWRHPEQAHRQNKVAATAIPSAVPSPEQAASTLEAPGSATNAAGAYSRATARTITIVTQRYEAELTARGGRLASFKLKDYRQTGAADSPPYEVIAGGDRLPLGLVIARGAAISDDGEIIYSSDAPAQIDVAAGGATVTLTGVTADGLKLTKTFAFKPDGYVFDVTAAVNPPAGMKIDGVGLQLSRPLTANAGFRDIPELQADVQDKVLNEAQKAIEKGVAPVVGTITYAGFPRTGPNNSVMWVNPPGRTPSLMPGLQRFGF